MSAESPSLVGVWLSSRESNTGKQNLPIRDQGDHVENKHVRAPDGFFRPISEEQTTKSCHLICYTKADNSNPDHSQSHPKEGKKCRFFLWPQSRRKDLKESRIVKSSLHGLVLWDALLDPGLRYPTVHSGVHRNFQRNQQPPGLLELIPTSPNHYTLPFSSMQALNPSWKLFCNHTDFRVCVSQVPPPHN